MYRIGEFSSKTNLSIRTLRYYNDIGLLIPEEVDVFTNYRYYSETNLKQVEMIQLLKDIGFTLEEIKDNWDNFTEEMFIKKKEQLLKEIDFKQESIKKIDELRSRIDNGKLVEKKVSKPKQKSIFN